MVITEQSITLCLCMPVKSQILRYHHKIVDREKTKTPTAVFYQINKLSLSISKSIVTASICLIVLS
jgi:hypothetical protein